MPADTAAFRHVLRRSGIRCTRQRETVYAALMASRCHPSAEELHRIVQRDQPGLSLATVYNTLEALTRLGLVRRLSPSSATSGVACRYDADVSSHAHLFTANGRVLDVPDDLGRAVLRQIPPDLIEQIERRMGVSVDRMSIEFIERPSETSEIQ